jgi:menaquinone-dependent protoporphyrinogen oxidase
MTRILIAYGTCDGHTARIAAYVAEILREYGCDVVATDLKRPGAVDLSSFAAVIVGASVHVGRHQKYVREFVRRNRHELDRLPSAFFSVSLAAHAPSGPAREEVRGYIDRFLRETGWRPDLTAAFAGALLYSSYGFLTRWIMRTIVRSKGGPDTDTSRDYVYTDWDQVRGFTESFLRSASELQPRSETASRAMRRSSSVGIT